MLILETLKSTLAILKTLPIRSEVMGPFTWMIDAPVPAPTRDRSVRMSSGSSVATWYTPAATKMSSFPFPDRQASTGLSKLAARIASRSEQSPSLFSSSSVVFTTIEYLLNVDSIANLPGEASSIGA